MDKFVIPPIWEEACDKAWDTHWKNVTTPLPEQSEAIDIPHPSSKRRSLFRADDRYTAAALTLENEATRQLTPLFAHYVTQGYSPREISHVLLLAIMTVEAEEMLAPTEQQTGK